MSNNAADMDGGALWSAGTLSARAAAAELRADQRLAVEIADFFMADDARLDDRERAALGASIKQVVGAVEVGMRNNAASFLANLGASSLAKLILDAETPVFARLGVAGMLHDAEMMRELIGRVRQEILAAGLPVEPPVERERARLTQHDDGGVTAAATALLAAENRRRSEPVQMHVAHTDLPAELHHRLVWLVAAALREQIASEAGRSLPALDRSLGEAALRSIAVHDEGDRLEATAMRLAAVLDPQADELEPLLVGAIADRRLVFFVALLGHALGLDYADARDIVLDPTAERLWLVLRALELDRGSIARIGLALSEADPRRDLDRFVEEIDAIIAIPAEGARAALAPLMLHRDYRAALLALAKAQPR